MVEKVLIIVIVIVALYYIVRRLLHSIAAEPGANPCQGCTGCSAGTDSTADSCGSMLEHGPEHGTDQDTKAAKGSQ